MRPNAMFAISMLVVCAARVAHAHYTPPRFFELVGGADLIVSGTIQSVGDETYTLKIERVLAGDFPAPAIEIKRFRDWACSQRYAPYERGQRLVAFLRHRESDDRQPPIYRTMSAGCEGEFPVVDNFAFCFLGVQVSESSDGGIGSYSHLPMARLDDLYTAIQGYRLLYRVTLGDLALIEKEGFRDYLFAKRIERLSPETPTSPFRSRGSALTTLERLEAFARQSYLHRILVDSTEQAAPYLGAPSIGWKPSKIDMRPESKIMRYRGMDNE